MATASKPCSAAVSSATQVTIAVTGTCPLIAPARLQLEQQRVERACRDAGAGRPATATVRAIGGASPIENRASSAPERRAISIATAESLPPPTGTSNRSSRPGVDAPGASREARGKAGAAASGRPFR